MTKSSAEGMGGFKDTRHVSPATLDARSYGQALLAAAREDERIVCLGADLSQPTQTDLFRDQIPDRFFMMGIQEANMVGGAGGMARVSIQAQQQPTAKLLVQSVMTIAHGGLCHLRNQRLGVSEQQVQRWPSQIKFIFHQLRCQTKAPACALHHSSAWRRPATHE